MSLINNKKSTIFATAAALVVLFLFGSVTFKTTPQSQNVKQPEHLYVAAKNTIKKGEQIKEEDLEIKDFPIEINGAYKATGELIGRVAKQDIEAQKPVIKTFIKEIEITEQPKEGILPQEGYRAIPVLVQKSGLPPYISLSDRFDLATKENSMIIENLRILNILDPAKSDLNKMLILEIKNEDVSAFIAYQVKTKGLIFLQKNSEDIGEYKFTDIKKAELEKKKSEEKHALEDIPKKASNEPVLPPIDKIKDNTDSDIESHNTLKERADNTKEVEIIVGSTKTKMEFNN